MTLIHHYEVWVEAPDRHAARVFRLVSRRSATREAAGLMAALRADPTTATIPVTVTIQRVPGLHPLWLVDALLLGLVGAAFIDPFWPRCCVLALIGAALLWALATTRRWLQADLQSLGRPIRHDA